MLDISSDEEEAILLLLTSKNTKKKAPKRLWVHEVNAGRRIYGEFHQLCRELQSHEDRFFWYFHMSRASFEELHEMLQHSIAKMDTNYRKAIGTRERLAVCLRYIRTGDSFLTISFSFRIGRSTVAMIVEQVSKAIWECLQPVYLPRPTEDIWKESEQGYREIWKFPNCAGSVDGKHVRIECPLKSGSRYHCYKDYFSIVLFAVADPFYKFTVVDVGSYGSHSDSGIFENSEFYRQYLHNNVLLPPKPLPSTNIPVPHVLIGDEGFALQTYLMRPFPRNQTINDTRKRRYNYRLCSARRIVENTFGILAEKWRVFHRPMECNVEKAIHVTKAACCLHNFVRIKDGKKIQKINEMTSNQELPEVDEEENQNPNGAFGPLLHTNIRSPNAAIAIREKFVSYFNQE